MALRCALLLALTAGAFAGPLSSRDTNTCATTCPESSKFSYEPGKTYEYQYESDVKTHIAGATEEHSSLHVRATALVEVLAPCEMALRLSDVSLQDSTPSQYESRQHVDQSWEFKKSLQEHPLRFAFVDGKVESVCGDQADATWVLNIKKGIVSAFQNTQTTLSAGTTTVESDVAGECPVEYTVEGSSWGTTTVKKTKDLLGCTERMGHLTAFQATPYRVESAIQSLPLMKSTHECTQKIKDGVIKESSCTELHVFRPFSRHNNGAVTEVTYKLTYFRENAGVETRQSRINTRSSLLFGHENRPEALAENFQQCQQTLEKLCRKSQDAIAPEVPRLFTQLTRQMRLLDTRTLMQFYRSATSVCPKATKFVRDAIPMLGSSASVSLIRDLIVSNEVDETDADIWLTSMAFIASPTLEVLREVKPLLSHSRSLRKAVLSISTLVHSYCRDNANCETKSEVRDIIGIFEDNLKYNCKAESAEQHDIILMSLKGIGNTGFASQVVPTLNRCFLNQELSTEMRVAALQAFRRMACDADMSEVLSLLSNNMEDSEIRIYAYLTLMQCPSDYHLDSIRRILGEEEVNQVGSFIWTHLTNLMETANPHKLGIRAILENEALKKTFDMDKRKFSRNIELSMFSHLINAGGMVDSNLIWSENSFIPRSASMNLTVDMFGESVNLMEIGGRVQGVEQTLEKIFGEKDNTVERSRRSTDSLTNIDRAYNLRRDDPQASYYIRVFGNEIRYDDLHDFDLSTLKDKLNYLDWLIELSKEHEFEMTKSMMFLDATMVVPTAAGLPLKLTVDGTSTINVNVNGKLDIRQMFASPSTFEINGSIRPSASLEVNGEMGVDAHVARTGLKMQTTMYTNTRAEGKIQLQDGKIFNLDVKAPEDNTEVLTANTKFFVVYREEEREQQMINLNRIEKSKCTCNKFAKVTGLELCGEVSLPWAAKSDNVPWFLLWGPASAKVVLNKKDSHDNYLLEAKYVMDKARRDGTTAITDIARFYFNTPNSRVNREILAEFTLDRAEKQLSFNLDTPWKKATLQGGLTDTAELKRFFTTATLDGNTEYSINAEVQIDEKSYRVDYIPKLEISIPGLEKILFNGEVRHRPGKKGMFSMALKNVFEEPIKVSGSIMGILEPNQMRYETDIDFSSHILNGKLATFVDNSKDQGNAVSSKFDLEYTYKNQPQQTIHFEQTFLDSSRERSYNYNLDGNWATTLIPEYNGDVHFDYVMTTENMNMNLNAGFDEQRRIIYGETATYETGNKLKMDIDSRFQFPYKSIDYSGRASMLQTDDEVSYVTHVKYAADKEGHFEIKLKRINPQPLSLLAEAKLQYPGREMSLIHTVEERAVKEYHSNLKIELQKYQNIEVNTLYKMEPRHEFTTNIVVPDVPQITVKGHLKPQLKNLQAHGEVIYDGSQYLADTNWVHRGGANNFNTEADMTVSYPERRITAQGSSRRQGSEVTSTFETKWDAARDENKKFILSSKVNIEKLTPGVEMQINVYPRHFINLNTNGRYATEGWYKSTEDLQGSLSLQTSFENFEDIAASFKHDRTAKAFKNEAEASWKPDQKITAKLNIKKTDGTWSNVENSLQVTTPFRGLRTINSDVTYNLADTTFGTNIMAQWERDQITLGFNGELDIPRHTLNGEITFASPYKNFESLSAILRHNDNGQNFVSHIETSWARGKQIAADFNMQHQGNLAAATNNGELSFTTPFAGYTSGKSTWQHTHNNKKIINVGQIEYEATPIYNHNVDVTIKSNARRFNIDINASMKAKNLDEITVVVGHNHDSKTYSEMASSASVQWAPAKLITYSHELTKDTTTLMGAKVKFTSPFEGFENLILNSNTNDESGKIVSSNEFKWGNNQKITLGSELTLNGYEFQKTIRFTSPFQGYQRIVMNVNNQKQDGIWVSHADLDYGKRIDIDTQFGAGFKKTLAFAVKSACPYMKDFAFSSSVNGNARNFRYNVEVSHEKLPERITLSGVANTADVNRIKLTGELATPYEPMRSLVVVFNHQIEGDSIHHDAKIEHPQYKGMIASDVVYRSGRSLSSNMVVEYLEGKKIELDTAFQFAPKVTGKIVWKSPIEKIEAITLTFDHEGSMESFATNGELSYNPRDKITANVNFGLRGNTLGAMARITTPFREANRVVLTVNHDGPLSAFKNDASFELNQKVVSGKSEFKLEGSAVTVKAELQTPYQGYETMTLEASHSGPATNFNNNALLTLGNQQLSGSSQFRLRRSAVTGNLALQLPFRKLSSLSVTVDHTGPWNDINNKVTVAYNNAKILSKVKFTLAGNKLDSKIVVKTPYNAARSISMEVEHEGPGTNFKNSAVLGLNDDEIRANSEFSLSGNALVLKGGLNTPYRKLKTMTLDVSHQGPMTAFTNNAILTYNNKEINGNTQFNFAGTTLTGKATLTLPKVSMAAEVNHDGPGTNFRNNALLTYGENRIEADSMFRMNSRKVVAKANLAYPGATFASEITHVGEMKDFNNNAMFKYNEHAVTGSSEFRLNGGSLATKASFSCPHVTMSGEVNHNGQYKNFNNNALFKYNEYTVTGSSEYSLNGDSLATKATFSCPHVTMSGEVNHNGPYNNFNNNALFTYDDKRVAASSEFSLNGNNLATKANLDLPSRRVFAELTHRGQATDFTNDFSMGCGQTKITGNSKFRINGNTLTTEATLNTPQNSMSFDASHDGPINNFKNSLNMAYNRKRISGNTEFTLSGNNLVSKATLNVPSHNMVLEVNHNGPLTNFVNDVKASLDESRASSNVQFKLQGEKLNGKAVLNLPSVPALSFELNHDGPSNNFKNDATFIYGNKQVSGNSEFKLRNTRLVTKATLNIPCSMRTLAVEVTHNGPATNFQNNAVLTIGNNNIRGGLEFSLQGAALASKGNLETTYGMEPISFEVSHDGPETNFANNIVVRYGRKQVTGNSEFRLEDTRIILKANAEETFGLMEPISIDFTQTGPSNSFTNAAVVKYGTYEMSTENEFTLRDDTFRLKHIGDRNFGYTKTVTIEINHDGPARNFNNNLLFSYGSDNIIANSEFSLSGTNMHLKASTQTTYRPVKPMSIEITHNGPLEKFENTIAAMYGNKEINSNVDFGIEGNTITGTLKLETPFAQVEKLIAKITHNGKNWRNFENSGLMKLNNDKYTGQSELRWFGKIFKLSAEVAIPDEYGIKINHKGKSTDFSNNMKIKIPGEKISGTSSFKMADNKIEARANMDSTLKAFSNLDLAFDHQGDADKFKSAFEIKTPFKGYKNFNGELVHEGSLANFESTAKLEMPFTKLRSLTVSANHQGDSSNFNNGASIIYDGKTLSGALNYKKTPRKLATAVTIATPYRGYENFGASVEHVGNMNDFKTVGEITTPIPDYNNFGFNVEHNGNMNNFRTVGSATSSIPGYERFGGSTEYRYDGALHAAATVQTPFQGYDEFGMTLDHSGNMNDFQTAVAVTTPIRKYKNFGLTVNHKNEGHDFTTGAELTTTVPGYNVFGATVEKKGVLSDFETSAQIKTPFRNYENLGMNMKHSGGANNFRCNGLVTTSVPGYERFAANVNHNGNLNRFSTNVEVQTPIPGHETYSLNLFHNAEDNVQSTATLEYPGKKYDFNLNHQGTARNFNTEVSLMTPHPGYERFAANINHNGDLSDFTQSGTITLPFRRLPELTYSVSHRGSLNDFTSSATLEYLREKIEGTGNWKMNQGWSESSYEGGLTLTTTYAAIRDLHVAGSHMRKSNQKSGLLDVTLNGVKTIDLDYDYTTSAQKTVSIKIRQPRPLETRINFNGDAAQFTGDAYLKWNKMNPLNGEMSLKNLAGDREIMVKATLPTRIVALTTGYTLTGTNLVHKTDLQWDNSDDKKLNYVLEGSLVKRGSQNDLNGRFNIQSPKVNGEVTLIHSCDPGRQATSELIVETTSRMSIKSELTRNEPSFTYKMTLEHPEIRRGATIYIEGLNDDKVSDGKIELQYNRETMTFTGRVADESDYSGKKYSTASSLSHPNSNLDFQWKSTMECNDEKTTMYLESKYLMASDGQYKIGSLRSEINKLRKEMNMEIITPLDTIRMNGRRTVGTNGVYSYTGEASCDHTAVRGELTINKASADMKLFYDGDNYLQASGSASPDMLKAEVFRMVSGSKIREALVSVQRSEERLVTGRSYLRPNMMESINNAMETTTFGQRMRWTWNKVSKAISDEYDVKVSYLKRNAKPFYKALVSIHRDIQATWEEVKADATQMYNDNEFHMKDIKEWFERAIEWTKTTYAKLYRDASVNYTKAQAAVIRGKRSLEDITEQTWTYTQNFGQTLSGWWEDMPEWSEISDRIQTGTRDAFEQVRSHPAVKKLVARIREMTSSSDMLDETVAAATSASGASYYDRMMKRDDVQAGIQYLKNQVKNSEFAAQYIELKKTVDEVMSDIHQNGLKTIRANLMAWIKDLLKTDKDSWSWGDGDCEFSLYVPLPMDDLRTIPKVDINLSQYLKNAQNMYNYYMPRYDWTFWDYYYNYKPSSNLKDMIPPFTAHATIAGDQHYMTFDKRFYEFAGECNYLLARDFIDGTFSVMVNYERADGRIAKKSITVISGDKTIEIFPEGKLIIDNSRVEMPVQIDGTTILREESLISIENKNGVKVTCELPYDRCTVEVSGWYFSKTAGLFGTYNNEPMDDFTTLDHRRVENTGEFAASWGVGSRCRPTNAAVDVSNEILPGTPRYEMCAKYFEEESSPFRRCFRVVEPKPFMKMCLNELVSETESEICKTAAFYTSECKRREVPVNIPSMCVRCEMEDGQVFTEGQNITISGDEIRNSADVVFVIHHSECNRMMLDNLKSMVDDLEKIFKTENMVNNRYSIIGYGGPGIESEPHVHTMDGQIFETRDKILLGLENFNTESGETEDAMHAVKYAAHLPFRAGVSKNVILMPCASCRQGKATFSELQQLLLFRDINFHVMMQYNFLFKGNKDAGTAYIFGVDRETVYTRKDAGTTELVGDPEIRSSILMPKDLCVALSEETDGSVFNTLQFINSRPFIQKRFMDVLVRVIADKAEPSDCQICDCVPNNIGAGKPVCRSCIRPSRIYDLMPRYEGYTLPPPIEVQPVQPSPPVKEPKTKKKKNQKQLNAKKRAMRERRLRRLQLQNGEN